MSSWGPSGSTLPNDGPARLITSCVSTSSKIVSAESALLPILSFSCLALEGVLNEDLTIVKIDFSLFRNELWHVLSKTSRILCKKILK